MKRGTRFILSILIAVAVWSCFSWPLPRHVTTGIPSAARNVEKDNHRDMIAGDHLQLLYHFWLLSDMIRGRTPWFHNLY
jgi:hypothetical protein